MKVAILAVLASVALCTALPAGDPETYSPTPGDNSHYVEGVSRYIWMPDGEGTPHLVDLHAKVDNATKSITKSGAWNQYWLFTRRNRHHAQVLVHNDPRSVQNSFYNGALPLKVIVHGWNNNGHSPMNPRITEAFLAVSDCNVIVVDWGVVANNIRYSWVAGQVPDVGNHLGNFIIWLFNTAGGNWDRIHMAGFSLGAHVVGNAGRTISGRAGRITGLDPAGPTFGGNSNALRASDARYVETIHTDGGLLGIMDPIADADFYPNGGRNPQPGCGISTCSHGRAPELFAASIHHNHFVGRQCGNVWEAELSNCFGNQHRMGNAIFNKWGHGLYGLRTGSGWPF